VSRQRSGGVHVLRRPRYAHHLVLLILVGLALLPIYFMVVNAFKTDGDYLTNQYGPPSPGTFGKLTEALRGGEFFTWLKNSFLLTTLAVGFSTVIAALGAYPIALMRWRPGGWLLTLMIALMVVPPIVLIIPLFQMTVQLDQLNTYRAVVFVYIGLLLPFSTFLLASFFRTMPRSLMEAARVDGAGHLRIWWSIVLPLSGPVLATVVVVQALWVWNEVLVAIVFLQQESLRSLMVGLTIYRARYSIDVPLVMAGMLWATIPMLLLYLLGQRFFVRGLTAGATKG
jgi:raffinose/stachyose/melibiose transport system permease protein